MSLKNDNEVTLGLDEAINKLINQNQVSESYIDELYKSQASGRDSKKWLNILLFFLGIAMLYFGVKGTYNFASSSNPHEKIRERLNY